MTEQEHDGMLIIEICYECLTDLETQYGEQP